MKKSRKILLICSIFLLSLFCAVGCGDTSENLNEKETDIIIVQNEIVAERGTLCELPYAYAEQDGVSYPVYIQINDKDGNDVPMAENSFYVESTNYTAKYYTIIDETKLVKTIPITVNDKTNNSIIIKGELEQWIEPGEFDLSSIDAVVKDYYGETVDDSKLTARLFDNDGNEITLTDGKTNLSNGKYILKYATDSAETVNSIGVFVSKREFDADGRLIYANFTDENQMSLFAADYDATFNYLGSSDITSPKYLTKNWQIRKDKWEVIFLSDGFADFSRGGRVTFSTVIANANIDYSVNYYPADGSEKQVIGVFKDLTFQQKNELSFIVPENGTLVGAKLEFVLKTNEPWAHLLGDFTIDCRDTIGDKKLELITPNDDVDLASLGLVVQNAGKTPITEGVTFEVINETNVISPKANGNYDLSTEGLYIIKPYVNGVAVSEDFKLLVREARFTADGKYKYMSMILNEDMMDQYLISTDFKSNIININTDVGVGKLWNTYVNNWTYTFESNGLYDISKGATIYFDAFLCASSGKIPATIILTKTNGEKSMIGSLVDDYKKHTFSFELEEGESLAGCQLTFVCSTNNLPCFMCNISIDYNSVKIPSFANTDVIVAEAGEFALSNINVLDTDGNVITDDIVYTVTENDMPVMITDGKITIEDKKLYTVSASVNGFKLFGTITLYGKNFNKNASGKYEYMMMSEESTSDCYMITPDFDFGVDKDGFSKRWNLYLTTWGYKFNANLPERLSNGATVYFDCRINNTNNATFTVKLVRADGTEEVLGQALGNYQFKTFSFVLASNEALKDCKIIFISDTGSNTDAQTFNNVVIEAQES